MPYLSNLLFTQTKQVLVTLEFEVALFHLFLLGLSLLLKGLLLIFQLVLHAFNMQFELLLNLDMVTHLSFVLLKHLLVLTWRLISTNHTLSLVSGLITLSVALTTAARATLLLVGVFRFLLLFHLHVHEDLYAGLDVLKDCERVSLAQSVALLRKDIFIVGVNLLTSDCTDRHIRKLASRDVECNHLPPRLNESSLIGKDLPVPPPASLGASGKRGRRRSLSSSASSAAVSDWSSFSL